MPNSVLRGLGACNPAVSRLVYSPAGSAVADHGSDAGGERAAIAYTVLGCCALAGVNPVEYLADVLPRLSRRLRLKDVPALMPADWKRSRSSR